jgi:hypothetical protein
MTLLELLRSNYAWTNDEILDVIQNRNMPMRDYDNCLDLVRQIKMGAFKIHRRTTHSVIETELKHNNNLWHCDDCETIDYCDDLHSVNHGDYSVCNSCLDDNYYYSERHDTYRHNDDYDEYDEDYQQDNGT